MDDTQNSEVFLSSEEKSEIKSIFEDDIFEENEIKKLKSLKSESFINSIKFGELYLGCYSNWFNNLNLFEGKLKSNLGKILNEFDVEELRNLLEEYGNGEEIGSHNLGEKIKDIVRENRIKLNKLINLFFEVIEE